MQSYGFLKVKEESRRKELQGDMSIGEWSERSKVTNFKDGGRRP